MTKLMLRVALCATASLIATAAAAQQAETVQDARDARIEAKGEAEVAAAAARADPELTEAEKQEIVVTARFIDSGAKSATKMDLSVKDTPFSVSSYSESFLHALQVTKVDDLYKYFTGVQRSGATGTDLSIRGFRSTVIDRNAQVTDGLPGQTVRFGSTATIATDHVELVKGPASVLYGQGQPGGFINVVSKKPEGEFMAKVEAIGNVYLSSLAHDAGGLLAMDVTGPIDANDTVEYRMIAQTGRTQTFRDNSFERPLFLQPMLAWNVGPATRIVAQVEYRRVSNNNDTYLIAPNGSVDALPNFRTSYQSPQDSITERGTAVSVMVDHQFDNGIKFHVGGRSVHHRDDFAYFDPVGQVTVSGNPNRVALRARRNTNKRAYNFVDANLSVPFTVGGIANKLLIGATYGGEVADFERFQQYNIPTSGTGSFTLDLYNPVYPAGRSVYDYPDRPNTAAGLRGLNHQFSTQRSFGAYASNLFTFSEHLKAMAGVRLARETSNFVELKVAGVPNRSQAFTRVLPLGGLIYQPNRDISLYTSYSTSFVPAPPTAVDVNNDNRFVPTTANSIEAGVKADLLARRMNLTAAVFRIVKKGVISTFTIGCPQVVGTCSQQTGREQSKGAELEINYRPIDPLQIAFGYAHTIARVLESPDAVQVGKPLSNTPTDSFHAFSRLNDLAGVKGLALGAGLVYVGPRNGLVPTSAAPFVLRLPAYTTADAAVYYDVGRFEMTLKFSNLFDARYIDAASASQVSVIPGAPRSMQVSARIRL